MIDVQALKQKAISYLEANGPTIPVRIAKELKIDPMWAGAILSELLQQHNVKFTSMKVGSTPIYYLEGQEQQLERFANEHLKGAPKEAYLLLKEKKILDDATLDPQTRVALRSLKDFAVMFNRGGRITWRYAFIGEDELAKLLGGLVEEEGLEEEVKESFGENNEEENTGEKEDSGEEDKSKEETSEEIKETIEEEKPEKIEKPEKKQPENIFEKNELEKESEEKEDLLTLVKQKLEKLNIKLLEETDIKKRELMCIGRMNGPLGETEILIIAKDKKSITDKDLEKIFEQIKDQKKQVLLFTTGEIAKKSIEAYRDYKNLIRIKPL